MPITRDPHEKLSVKCWLYWIRAPHHTDITKEGYVGITTKSNPKSRFTEHKKVARLTKRKLAIHNAIDKYGDSLIFEVILKGTLEYCMSIENALRPLPNIGYNIGVGGASPRLYSKQSKEAILKRNESAKGYRHSEETKRKISEGQKGKIVSEETKAKMRKGHAKNAYKPWERSNANLDIWGNAIFYMDVILENIDMTCNDISKILGIRPCTFKTIFRYVKGGWNPKEDEKWLTFFKKD